MTLNTSTNQIEAADAPSRPAHVGALRDTDADLMAYMAMSDDDPAAAQEAWAEFYERHVRYLYAVCLRAYGAVLSADTGVSDLVIETFRRAFRNAHQFHIRDEEDPERTRRRARAWLGRIAQRLLQDLLRQRGRLPTVHLDPEMWQQVAQQPRSAPAADNALVERVREALERLSEKEQTVIRITFQWYRPGQTHQRLPNDVAAELAGTLRTTPENLRQIRRRALQKIRRFVRKSPERRP